MSKSNLSAEAKEWFPAGYVDEAQARLLRTLDEVTYSPGRFATLSGPLVESFAGRLSESVSTSRLVDAIVSQAVREPNFRYNAARLCTMFDCVDGDTRFRPLLLQRVQTGLEADEPCGLAAFLAELYMQLDDATTTGGRVSQLADALCRLLAKMLTSPDDRRAKTACQVLKLAGLALDADRKARVDEIFSALRSAEAAGVQAPLVRNLVNLRRSRWGSGGFADLADEDAPRISQEPPPRRPPASLYLPDGHALTDEEAAFLERHMPADVDDDDEPDMSEEQHADFLDFLELNDHRC